MPVDVARQLDLQLAGVRKRLAVLDFAQFMRKNGIAVGASGGPEPHPRFETPPGLQLQFDWKESVKMANRDGELFEFKVFAATLGHSRGHVFIRSIIA